MDTKILEANSRLEGCGRMLTSLGPQNVLDRGYSYVQGKNGKLISSQKDYGKLKEDSDIMITFKDGKGMAKVSKEAL